MQQGLSGYIVGKSVPPERPWQQERAKASHNPSPSHTPDARTRFRVRMQPAEPSYGGPSRTHMLLLEQDTARHASPCLMAGPCNLQCCPLRQSPVSADGREAWCATRCTALQWTGDLQHGHA